MGSAVVTLRIMPESPETDLSQLQEGIGALIDGFTGGSEKRYEIKPVAFGLKALQVLFTMPEDVGDTEKLEIKLAELDGVQSVDVTDVRRTLG